MRPALQRLLGSPSALLILRNAIELPQYCQSCWSCIRVSPKSGSRGYSSKPEQPLKQDTEPNNHNESTWKLRYVDEKDLFVRGDIKKLRLVTRDGDIREVPVDEKNSKTRNQRKKEWRARKRQRLKDAQNPQSTAYSVLATDGLRQDILSQLDGLGGVNDSLPLSGSRFSVNVQQHSSGHFESPPAQTSSSLTETRRVGQERKTEGRQYLGQPVGIEDQAWLNFVSLESYSEDWIKSSNMLEMTDQMDDADAELDPIHPRSQISVLPESALNILGSQKSLRLQIFSYKLSLPQSLVPSGSISDWRFKLITTEQYEYESSVHLPALRGPRLIEYHNYTSDFELWLQLILYRRRHHGVQGLKGLWEQIRARNLDLPTEGATANKIWTCFVEMGLECRELLPNIIEYATSLQIRRNRHWEDLYTKIVRVHIKERRPYAYHYHSQLYTRFPPTAAQFLSFFDLDDRTQHNKKSTLQSLYKDLPFRNLYAAIMERLYRKEDFLAAASWHNILVPRGDVPSDLDTYRPLFRYMVLHGDQKSDQKALVQMVDNMVQAGIPLPSFIKHPLPISPVSQEIIDKRLAEVHGITPKIVGDEFCARIFATAWFSINTVINLLGVLGVGTVGAHSLREICIRENSVPKAVHTRIKQLEASGITLAPSTYCSLVSRLATEDNTRLLENVTQCDLHPEAFEDMALQESLLSDYHENGDQLQIDRTLAILMAKCEDESLPSVHWNVQLRLRLKQKNIPAVNRILEVMHASEVPIEPLSSSYVRISLLTRRAMGRRPLYIYDLPIVINIWQNVLRSGGYVPCIAWMEILRRLGMTGQLEAFEKLSLWLAKYYSGSSSGPSLGLLSGSQVVSREFARRLINVPSQLSTKEKTHPLYVLFPPRVQQAIIAWGFQHARIGFTNWRWGLELLLKLKLFRVSIHRETVVSACRLRLGMLFSRESSRKKINEKVKGRNAAPVDYYFREMERIGGKALFFGPDYPRDDEERIQLLVRNFSPHRRRSTTKKPLCSEA